VQILFLDFDGARVDTTPFRLFGAEPGVRDLSPLAAFLPRWGLAPSDEPALVEVVVATVRELLVRDVVERGANPRVGLRVRSSADSPDPTGEPNVTRVIVGGSIAEAVFAGPTVGVAESIDPGNFAREETALVLLDLLSGPPDDPTAPLGGRGSLNHYLTEASDKIRFIGRSLGYLAAHEAGHLYGNWHTDGTNAVPALMDRGNPLDLGAGYGVGPDGVGGTADDVTLRLVTDAFGETFTGVQDTLNVTAFGLTRGRV
jgi:hypothetical protein